MTGSPCWGAAPKKETARVLAEGHQAGEYKFSFDSTADELEAATGECSLLALLQARLSRFNTYLYPLTGDRLLLSQPGGFTLSVPDLRSALQLLRQWEGA